MAPKGLDSRGQAEDYYQDNRTQKTGDENGSTAGRIENDFTASGLFRRIRLLRRGRGLGRTFSHHETPPRIKAQPAQSFRSRAEMCTVAYKTGLLSDMPEGQY